ncbi:hypothetical protein DD238_008036 [Peronospora effusa]|uniref:Uncharacterized protein n=1 Tax=Peronospora effusa TaxID=542832 RepID=A0A3M6VBR6_9STRA|nr:hypothetical protein DD238_008036 [Peronospora effusa]
MTSIKKKPSAGREQPSMAQRLPPPWAQQTPLETEIVVQPREAQSVPPPWDQQTPLVLARLAQSGTLHLTEPPWRQQRPLNHAVLAAFFDDRAICERYSSLA